MKKYLLFVFLALFFTTLGNAQVRGVKVGYIDMEYILQNVTAYAEAETQLEQKAQKWRLDGEGKIQEVNKLKDALKAEKVLLTKNLIEEREAEIKFLENENLEYQQQRFGANGELISQKSLLLKPIQDQVFTAVQDIAERLKYDFIFDKSSDLTMLFAAKRFDISEQVLRALNRTEKREQLTKKQQKELEAKELQENQIDDNPDLADRQKLLDEKKAVRDNSIEARKLLQEQKKAEFEEKRKQIAADREAKRNGTKTLTPEKEGINTNDSDAKQELIRAEKQKQADAKVKVLEDRKKIIEDRKIEQENRRKKTLEEREAKKNGTVSDSTKNEGNVTVPAINQLQQENENKTASNVVNEKARIIEERKRQLEERKKKVLEEREANKKKSKNNTNNN
ncbi:Skp family chaperone for outer membrane proteins [Flavobacterium sp. PL11]|jgi:Skp family chaperone for outer membrane proteins|uniref:OmpH family outer membrane protein n=1 Tax=Flavobacterium sp. PL11 TaxID=3071717 RepID=UPI002DFC5976|nr:Skp family chaperone for outer membrane proteins [Flavobacterium sp. PL11]